MFTGIVSDRGEVEKVDYSEGGRRIWVRSALLAGCAIGASVAIDGVCLTVVDRDEDVCAFDVSQETVDRSTAGSRKPGDLVNLERPLRAGEELGGHIVQGHVDGVGRVTVVSESGTERRVRIAMPAGLSRYLVEKGSITVDGVSLTVVGTEDDVFEVALVPHTLAVTTLGDLEPGREVNLEVDVLAKYVERLAAARADNEAS